MKVIKKISEQVDEELKDAQKYIRCAYAYRDDYPELAETYYKLSVEEMGHVSMLHDAVVKIINEYAETNPIPEGMQAIYDYLHEQHIKTARKIKAKQDEFREEFATENATEMTR